MKTVERLAEIYDVTPIMSENASSTDTRFGKADEFKSGLEAMTGKSVIDTIAKAEPIGPRELLDILIIMPCTGNTLAKLAAGITDTAVTMAAKAHLRSGRPVVIAVSTNDGLSGNAKNIGELLSRKNIFFVPFSQDDPVKKENSLVADFDLTERTVEAAMCGKQLQPLLLRA
jgi:dipicolinate synthase subunit B